MLALYKGATKNLNKKRIDGYLYLPKSGIDNVLERFENEKNHLQNIEEVKSNNERKKLYKSIVLVYREWFGKNSIKSLDSIKLEFDKDFFDAFTNFFFKILNEIYTKDERKIIDLRFFKNYSKLEVCRIIDKPKRMTISTLEKIKLNNQIEISVLQLLLSGKSNLSKRYLLKQAKDIDEEFISMYYLKVQDYLDDNVIPTIIDLAVIS